jgi:hypothetical protein
MKQQFKKWTFRLMVTGMFLFGLLIIFILNPTILYANKTSLGNYSIYHNKPLNKNFQTLLQQSNSIIKSSEIYNPELKIDICLKDGSAYPGLIEKVLGRESISTFYNKVVFNAGEVDFDNNYIKIDGHKLNLTEMLAHVQVHCLEFKKYGLWKSNPIAKHPKWKWEGYAEYIGRQHSADKNLKDNIQKLLQAERVNNAGWMMLADSTEIITAFFKYRLLIQYCLEIKKMSFMQLMEDKTPEETVTQQMIAWYSCQATTNAAKK